MSRVLISSTQSQMLSRLGQKEVGHTLILLHPADQLILLALALWDKAGGVWVGVAAVLLGLCDGIC